MVPGWSVCVLGPRHYGLFLGLPRQPISLGKTGVTGKMLTVAVMTAGASRCRSFTDYIGNLGLCPLNF